MIRIARQCVPIAALLFAVAAHAAPAPCERWPAWERFKQQYLSEDGRIVDASTRQQITVSEGQAYALTFALIANDREAFAKVLRWTQDNLAKGSLDRSLPAWKWGRAEDGQWTVLDQNSASDADLWTAYALGQADRLWHQDAYAQLSRALSELILRDEVAWIPGLGATLLPGPKGFVAQQTWRLNASYAPVQLLRSMLEHGGNRLWADVLDSSTRIILGSAPRGFVSDWIGYHPPEGFVTDASTHGVGSYDAIRVYLWAGMLDADTAGVARRLEPMAISAARLPPPELIDTGTLEMRGAGPPGFSAALLPLLAHFKSMDAVQSYRARVDAESLRDNQHYYSDALALFGLGWLDGRYRFDRTGDLRVRWTASCFAR